MYPSIHFRTGDEESLANEFIQLADKRLVKFEIEKLENPHFLDENNILAVHYADSGAQGDAGAVEILYCSQNGLRYLYGNYAYGNLNLDAVIQKLPMLKCLDSRGSFEPPYPFGGKLDIPEGWGHLYMGAMNHLYIRMEVVERVRTFISIVCKNAGSWQAFNAIAWFCGMKITSQNPDN